MEQRTLRERVRRLLSVGALPASIPESWRVGGHGTGRDCRVCIAPVTRQDVEVQLDGDLIVHPGCYVAWKEEIERSH